MIGKLFQTVLQALWRAVLVIVAVATVAGITLTAMTLLTWTDRIDDVVWAVTALLVLPQLAAAAVIHDDWRAQRRHQPCGPTRGRVVRRPTPTKSPDRARVGPGSRAG